MTEALLAAAAITPGENVLELSAGTGDLASHLVELVGPDGSLVVSDVTPAFVALIERGSRTCRMPAGEDRCRRYRGAGRRLRRGGVAGWA